MKFFLLIALFTSPVFAEQYGRAEINGEVEWIRIASNETMDVLTSTPFSSFDVKATVPYQKSQLRPPIDNGNVFAVGLNFRSHAGNAGEKKPEIFFKSAPSIRVDGDIVLPPDARNVHFEGELVIVIGKPCNEVEAQQAKHCVFGYTVGNDLTERSWQSSDLQWWRAKGAKDFGPVSALIQTNLDISNQAITTTLNGKVVQQESLENMIHSVEAIVSYISQYIPLKPGDLIFAGTPGRTRALQANDTVSVSIEGIGEVTNTIRH